MKKRIARSKEALSETITELFLRNWASKITAFIVTLVVFILTRDEVTRTFEVPLRVQGDPTRLLLTELPENVQIKVRGPWTRINRLHQFDFGSAQFDLTGAKPGPLAVDGASIVMPPGVILAAVEYDPVDLRFESIEELELTIKPRVTGRVAAGYERVRVEISPLRFKVKGGSSALANLDILQSETIEIDDATADVLVTVKLVQPQDVSFVGGSPAEIDVRVVVNPVQTTERYVVPIAVPRDLREQALGVVAPAYSVTVSGPAPTFSKLHETKLRLPVVASISEIEVDDKAMLKVSFEWVKGVPQPVRDRLIIETKDVMIQPAPPIVVPEPPTIEL